MFKTLKNAFKIQDVRRRIFYVFMMLVVVRLGSQLPVPFIDSEQIQAWFASQTGDAFNFLDAFTGGSFENMSIFALNITPYITSSIIIQLLTIAIPKLEEMQRDGEDGRKKLAAITRYVTVGLALFESVAFTIGFHNQGWIADMTVWKGISCLLYTSQFRGTMKGKALRGNTISYGEYGIVATEPCWIRSNQIEAARIAMTRYIKRGGKVWIKIFPDKPVTAKPAETRMGSGKGTLEYWVAVVKPGRVMFEIAGVPEEVAREALRLAMHKLPCKCKIVSRADLEGGDNSEN